jgi:hypothetical protein
MSEIDPFENLTSFPTATSSEPESLEKSGMGRDAFLRIFLTQLSHQDPLSPQDASELGAQLAVFSQVEQQTLMAEQLRGVNARLDTLIESLAKPTSGALDPLGLIGKQVEVAASDLRADAAGSSGDALVFEVEDAGVQSLLIAGKRSDGKLLGLAALGVPNNQAELARGTYELRFAGGQLQLTLPDGSTLAGAELPLSPFVRDPVTGQLRGVAPGSPGAPDLAPVLRGSSHELSVATRDRLSAYRPLTTYVTGTVSAVRVVDGKQVVTVNGGDQDLSSVIRVQ